MLTLKVDGRKVDVLLLGLRNGFYLHQKYLIFLQKKRIKWNIFVLLLYVKSYVCFLGIKKRGSDSPQCGIHSDLIDGYDLFKLGVIDLLNLAEQLILKLAYRHSVLHQL